MYVKQDNVTAHITFSAVSWERDGPEMDLPLVLYPRLKYKFRSDPPQFIIWSILGNPMILMSVIPLGLLLLMPKMIQGMDPETLKEFQESQKKAAKAPPIEMPDVSQTLANWFAPKDQAPQQSQSKVDVKHRKKKK